MAEAKARSRTRTARARCKADQGSRLIKDIIYTQRESTPCHLECRFSKIFRVWSCHHLELTWLNHKAHLPIPESQLFTGERELDTPLLARLERSAPKAFQLFNGPRHAGVHVANVEVHHFVTCTLANILDVDAHG